MVIPSAHAHVARVGQRRTALKSYPTQAADSLVWWEGTLSGKRSTSLRGELNPQLLEDQDPGCSHTWGTRLSVTIVT